MKKLSVLLTVLLVLGSFGAIFTVGSSAADKVWDGTSDMSWYSPNELSFLITTPEQLAGLAELANMGVQFEGQTIYLGSDIVLNTGDASKWVCVRENVDDGNSPFKMGEIPANKWTPIGTVVPFAGTFDGQGHTISGLYYFGSESTDNNIGLFAQVGGFSENALAVIKNVSIVNSYVNGYINVGAVIGYVDAFVTVENCYSDATVDANYFNASNAAYHGAANSFIGGIAGRLSNAPLNVTFDGCWYSGTICTWPGNMCGGIVGGNASGEDMDCEFTIKNCMFTGTVICDQRAGGIIGRYACGDKITIKDCYVRGTIGYIRTGNYGATIGGFRGKASSYAVIDNVYFDSEFVKGYTPEERSPVPAKLGCFEENTDKVSPLGLCESATYYTPLDDTFNRVDGGNDYIINESEGVLVPNGNTIDPFIAALDTNVWGVKDGAPVLKNITTTPGTVPATTTLPAGAATSAPETTKAPETSKTPETTKAPETSKTPDETTKAPETSKTPENTTKAPETSKAPENTTKAPEDTKAPEGNDTTKTPAGNDTANAPIETTGGNGGGLGTGAIIGIVAACVVAVAAIVIAIVLKKKKA